MLWIPLYKRSPGFQHALVTSFPYQIERQVAALTNFEGYIMPKADEMPINALPPFEHVYEDEEEEKAHVIMYVKLCSKITLMERE